MEQENKATSLPSIPESWPGGFGIYKYSKQAVNSNLGTIIILGLINMIVSGAFQFTLKNTGSLIGLVFGSLVNVALVSAYIAGVRKQKIEVDQAIKQSVPLWLNAIGLSILTVAALMLSLVLLIIPFFIVLPRLSLAFYFLVDKKLGIVESMEASWNATKGHSGMIWGVILATFAMALLCITIIGIPFAIYFLIMYSASSAVVYEYLNQKSPAKTNN